MVIVMIPLRDMSRKPGLPAITIILIEVMIFAFLTELQTRNLEQFIVSFALIPAKVDFTHLSSLFAFLTAMFLHGGLVHILSNLWFLWIFGDNVELELGRSKFLALFLLSGIGGSLLHFFIYPNSNIPILGASGAIAGVLGAYLVLFPRHRVSTLVPLGPFLTVMKLPAYVMIGFWVILQIVSGVTSFAAQEAGGVGWWAHIGGFAVGLALAFIYRARVSVNS